MADDSGPQEKMRQVVPIREEYLAICGDNWILAGILNQAVFKAARAAAFDADLEERSKHFKHPDDLAAAARLSQRGWMAISTAEWMSLCMFRKDESTFRGYLAKLVALGYMESRATPRYQTNGIKEWRVSIVTIVQELAKKGYSIPQEAFRWYSDRLLQINANALAELQKAEEAQETERAPGRRRQGRQGRGAGALDRQRKTQGQGGAQGAGIRQGEEGLIPGPGVTALW